MAPVCSSWKLEIAAENKDWEAHIFEIELYSGDQMISGAGMGSATSDCERSSPDGAFDGDVNTKYVTCSGNKVGKSVTYKLTRPNGVTKIKTVQWGSANNAIPKFDLYCSTDDVTFSYVWTADLGTGAGTNEVASGFAAPTPPTPVCSSWKLEIAAENKDWEAHIFEIELYSGDQMISGAGMGSATSDCERSSPDGAFDGDVNTKYVTCSGNKVGKSVTYKLTHPNGVTKIKTVQWGSANNAIPKFDLYCSTDDVTFSYVWTADLGTGAGTNEVASGFAAPSHDMIANFAPPVAPPPVCSSWKLEIAAENKDWEAHIFEIELYNGNQMISGAGMGSATSDCERSSPDGAFDGDVNTKYVTCSGNKVGKSVTYKLTRPNGVTKIKTVQWGSANNAIPKFDLYCSTDDVTFSYVWTADLGTGAGTNEALAP